MKKINAKIKPNVFGRIDPQYFESILTNLVENAIKYGGGNPVHISLNKTEPNIILTVADEGLGINQKNKR